jgi:hypothetical protein
MTSPGVVSFGIYVNPATGTTFTLTVNGTPYVPAEPFLTDGTPNEVELTDPDSEIEIEINNGEDYDPEVEEINYGYIEFFKYIYGTGECSFPIAENFSSEVTVYDEDWTVTVDGPTVEWTENGLSISGQPGTVSLACADMGIAHTHMKLGAEITGTEGLASITITGKESGAVTFHFISSEGQEFDETNIDASGMSEIRLHQYDALLNGGITGIEVNMETIIEGVNVYPTYTLGGGNGFDQDEETYHEISTGFGFTWPASELTGYSTQQLKMLIDSPTTFTLASSDCLSISGSIGATSGKEWLIMDIEYVDGSSDGSVIFIAGAQPVKVYEIYIQCE